MLHQMTLLATVAAEAPADSGITGTFQEIGKTFKIIPELFIPSLISFLLVAFLLKKYAFGPIQQVLEQRKQRIADGEAKLAQIEKQLAESEQHTAEVVAKANADAKRLIEEAKSSASIFSEAKAQEAVASAQSIIAKAEAAAKAERAQIAADLKREFGRLVVSTAQQATGGKLNADQQRAINEEAFARVEA